MSRFTLMNCVYTFSLAGKLNVLSSLQPGFQCGVNVLVHVSITIQPVLTKGRDTNVGVKAHATLGLVFLKSDGANDTSEKSSFPLTFP